MLEFAEGQIHFNYLIIEQLERMIAADWLLFWMAFAALILSAGALIRTFRKGIN